MMDRRGFASAGTATTCGCSVRTRTPFARWKRREVFPRQGWSSRRFHRANGVRVLTEQPHVVAVPAEANPRRSIILSAKELRSAVRGDQRDARSFTAELPVRGTGTAKAKERSVGRARQLLEPASNSTAVVGTEAPR